MGSQRILVIDQKNHLVAAASTREINKCNCGPKDLLSHVPAPISIYLKFASPYLVKLIWIISYCICTSASSTLASAPLVEPLASNWLNLYREKHFPRGLIFICKINCLYIIQSLPLKGMPWDLRIYEISIWPSPTKSSLSRSLSHTCTCITVIPEILRNTKLSSHLGSFPAPLLCLVWYFYVPRIHTQ